MQANDFIAKVKADGSANDNHDLEQVYSDYKRIAEKLPSKDKGAFCLNILCILSRNIDKISSWREKIDCKDLLTLVIDCVRGTRGLERPERIKTLACIYHIHRYVVKQPTQSMPELVLKLSYMPFEYECENLLQEHGKTYWHLLADRLVYMDKLKSGRRAIIKLLPKFSEDIQKVIHMYDSKQFCSTVLVFLLKKLHYLYNGEHAKDLNTVFGKIFESLSLKKDANQFRKLSEKEILDLYVKFNDSFYIITENGTKLQFKDSCLNAAIKTSISFIGHAPDMFHCLQTFYLISFCCILSENNNASYDETVLNNLRNSCETTEKLGHLKAMKATYPYINQLLRLYIEYKLSNTFEFTVDTQESCLSLILFLLEKLENTEQLLKCDGCNVKSGLHDALRLSFLAKNLISTSLNTNLDITKLLETYQTVVETQHRIMKELCRLGCPNYEKCLRKLQTDIHNTAILLNKHEHYNAAIKLFDTYLLHEFLHFKSEQDLKNISRALYNESICELERKCYEMALIDAFLSLIFAQPEGSSEKYMSLVMDIKAKSLKSREDEDPLQLMTVLDACCLSLERKVYGNLKPFFSGLKFSSLLHHEFSMYAKLWPSLVPIAGVWKALHRLVNEKQPSWILVETNTLDILHTIIMSTPTHVRTMQNAHCTHIVTSLLEAAWPDDVRSKVVEATLLFLKSEFNVAEAAARYEWKCKDQTIDPDMVPYTRTMEQEYEAMKPAIKAIDIWTKILPQINSVPDEFLLAPLLVLRVSLQQLLLQRRLAPAAQLAHVAAAIGKRIDREAFLEAAGTLLSMAHKPSPLLKDMLTLGAGWANAMLKEEDTKDAAVVFTCDAAIYYHNIDHIGSAARFLRFAQAAVLSDQQTDGETEGQTDGETDKLTDSLAVGRLLDGIARFGGLSAKINAQRHYLLVGNHEVSWCARHRRSLLLKRRAVAATERAVALTRRLRFFKRSRAAAASALGAAGAAARVALCAATQDTARTEVARKTIDLNLKYILGLPSNDAPREHLSTNSKESEALFTPEHFEMMRDGQMSKAQASPTIPKEYVPKYKPPKFFEHENDCTCYACGTPACLILAVQIIGLEASVYFRAKQMDIAQNYFDGLLISFCTAEAKLKLAMKKFKEREYEKYIIDLVEKIYETDLFNVELDILIEASFFELSQKNYTKADDYIYVRIQEILQIADVDSHLKNDIMNLTTASEKIRQTSEVFDKTGLENDLENLKLTPTKEILKTPDAKPSKPPVIPKVVVNKDELPEKKRKVPILNFDDAEENKSENVPKPSFKIPVPITAKPMCESIPSSSRSKVKILVTEPSEDLDLDIAMTPQADKTKAEFFTPLQSTPDQFFTPITSVKTYGKKPLRQNIVKNLEEEFMTPKLSKDPPLTTDPPKVTKLPKSTKTLTKAAKDLPKSKDAVDVKPARQTTTSTKASKLPGKVAEVANKENDTLEAPKTRSRVETGSLKSLRDSRLKRSTSPGTLPKEDKAARGGRLPRPTSSKNTDKK